MICKCKNPITYITGVERLEWKSCRVEVAPRTFSALAFRMKGTAEITANSKTHFVSENDIIYLPQGVSYTAEYSDTEMIVVHFETILNDVAPEVYTPTNKETIHEEFLRAHRLWQEKKPGYEAYVRARLYSILGNLSETAAAVQMPDVFLRTISYINTHYTDGDLSVQRICRHVGISATKLRTLFRNHYEKTPTEYITQLRLECARNMIACGVHICEAAEKSGFNDTKYFARVVKKHFGCTPRAFKSYGK